MPQGALWDSHLHTFICSPKVGVYFPVFTNPGNHLNGTVNITIYLMHFQCPPNSSKPVKRQDEKRFIKIAVYYVTSWVVYLLTKWSYIYSQSSPTDNTSKVNFNFTLQRRGDSNGMLFIIENMFLNPVYGKIMAFNLLLERGVCCHEKRH